MRRYQLIPSHAVQTLLITSVSPLPSGETGNPYSFTFNAIGGVAPYSWSEVGSIPTGLTLSSSGTLSGTPGATFASSFSVTVTDSVGSQFTRSFGLTILTGVAIATASPLPNGTVGVFYSDTITATGGATPYAWSILSQSGANGWIINSSTGVLSGTPGVAEVDSINIQVVDALGIPSAKNFNLSVVTVAGLTITNASPLPNATQQQNYQGTVTLGGSGGTPFSSGPPYIFSLISQTGGNNFSVAELSPGVTPYLILGTPQFSGLCTLVIQIQDSLGATAQKTFSLTVTAVTYAILTGSPLANAVEGSSYHQSIVVQGGVPPYSYAITSGKPAWLSIDPVTGVLSGTAPGAIENDSFVVQVTDSSGGTNPPLTKTYALSVVASGPPAFNFFISPTGDDVLGTGSLASPWSLKAFQSKQATYAGKVIGLIGDQGVFTSWKSNGTTSTLFSQYEAVPVQGAAAGPILPINGGPNSATPTYVASCDSSGNYSPRLAIIDCSNPVGGALPANQNAAVMGFNVGGAIGTVPNIGNFVIDGLVFRNFTFAAVVCRPSGVNNVPGVIVTNCEISNVSGQNILTNGNPGAIWVFGMNAMQVTNNLIHDLSSSPNASGTSPLGVPAYIQFNSFNMLVKNNTTYNCIGFSQKDNQQSWILQYNYIGYGAFGNAYNVAANPPSTSAVLLHAAVNNFLTGVGMVTQMDHNIVLGPVDCDGESTGSANTNAGIIRFFNNTFYQTVNSSHKIIAFYLDNGMDAGGTVDFYNNIVYGPFGYEGHASSEEDGTIAMVNVVPAWIGKFDHNYYGNNATPGFAAGMTFGWGSSTGSQFAQPLSSWLTHLSSAADPNSTLGPNPFPTTPTVEGVTSQWAITGAATTAGFGGVACGALDGSGSIGCNFTTGH